MTSENIDLGIEMTKDHEKQNKYLKDKISSQEEQILLLLNSDVKEEAQKVISI